MPEPKVIGAIASNIEQIRAVVETSNTELLLGIQAILTGDAVKKVIETITEKLSDNNDLTVSLKDEIRTTNKLMNKQRELLSKQDGEITVLQDIASILGDINKNIVAILQKTGGPKLSDGDKKDLEKSINDSMKDNKMGKMTQMMNIMSQLKEFSLKDIIFANLKVKQMEKVFDKMMEMTNKADDKDFKKMASVVGGTLKLVEDLAKMKKYMRAAKKGVKKLDKILFGKHGLIKILNKIDRHKKSITSGTAMLELISASTKQLVLISLLLSVVAITGIPALLGVFLLKYIIKGLIKVEKILSKNQKRIAKGNAAMLMMIAGIVLFSISLVLIAKSVQDMDWETILKVVVSIGLFLAVTFVVSKLSGNIVKGALAMMIMGAACVLIGIALNEMYEAIEDMDWEKVGMMGVIVLELGLLTAAAGVFAGPIALGAIALALMGGAFIALGFGIQKFNEWVTDNAISKVEEGIPKILNAICSIFKSDKTNPSFGDGLIGIVIGALKVGGAIFAAGALIFVGIALGVLAFCLKPWDNVSTKSIDNIEYVVGKLNKIFKLDSDDDGGGLGSIGDGFLGLALAALQFGKTLLQAGTILIITFTLALIKGSIEKWKDFDRKSIDNIEFVYGSLCRIFKLDNDENSGISGMVGNIFGLATSALQFGKTMFQMGMLLIATYAMGLIKDNLEKWSTFDTKCIENFEMAYNEINRIFKLDDNKNSGIGGIVGNIFGLATSALQFGKSLFQIGQMLLITYSMGLIKENLEKWKDFDFKCIKNFEQAYDTLKRIFKIDDDKSSGIGGILSGGLELISGCLGLMSAALQFGKSLFQIGQMLLITSSMGLIQENLEKWKDFDFKCLENFEKTYSRLNHIFEFDNKDNESVGGVCGDVLGLISTVLKFGKSLFQIGQMLLVTYSMGLITENLEKWKDFDFKCLENFEQAYGRLNRIFKFDEEEDTGLFDIVGDIFGLASATMKYGKSLLQIGQMLTATYSMGLIRENL